MFALATLKLSLVLAVVSPFLKPLISFSLMCAGGEGGHCGS